MICKFQSGTIAKNFRHSRKLSGNSESFPFILKAVLKIS
ncbi:hypothetical protein LEP1GSC168_3923 [Leptospira santarosai str. HAI134]|nr:hypothetical protein LEP1GSC168_3923 [Leptospira santarosai str. HAI134]